MFCSKCGKENKDDASICVQCGAPLGEQEAAVARRSSGSGFWKGVLVGVIALVVMVMLIGVIGRLTCETPASVRTDDATGITANAATLNGDLTDFNDSVDAYVLFQWGTSSKSYLNETEARKVESTGRFSFDLTGLTSNTTYYYRVKADCGGYGTTYGKEKSFTTP